MTDAAAAHSRRAFALILAAAAILMITMGARQTTGLFVQPIMSDTGIGIAAISFALAVGQFMWGAAQPVFGAIADQLRRAPRARRSARCCWRSGSALTPFARIGVRRCC